MAYATAADVFAEWGEDACRQLVRRASTDDADTENARITGALEEADATINSYIGGVVNLPLADTPVVIKRVAIDLAYVLMHGATNLSERLQSVHQMRLSYLKDVSSGRATLGLTGNIESPTATSRQAVAVSPSDDLPMVKLTGRIV